MEKITMYRYLGTNGIIDSPVHLEDTYYVRMVKLIADPNYLLTNGTTKTSMVLVPEDEVDEWYETARA